jgi:hypothetical protein
LLRHSVHVRVGNRAGFFRLVDLLTRWALDYTVMNIEKLWANLRRATLEREAAEEKLKTARDALVSRLCSCYREDEDWEDRAVWCSKRMSDTCPYYLELRRQNP